MQARPKGKWSNGPPQFKDQKSSAASASLLHSAAPNFKEQEDRLAFLGVSLVGCRVIAELKDGKQYEGILHTMNTTNEIGAVLRMARLITNGKAGGNAVDRLVLTSSDILGISAYSVNLSTEESSTQDNLGFLTDAAIGARAGEFGRERELVQWQPSASDPITAGSLEDGEDGKWDQFSTNERLFGVTTDFNEELYTTAIDRSAPDFKQKEAEARRMAREIENETKMSDNIHILEERNIVVPNDGMDEEEKYSSVIRQPGKYVPPGARVTGGKNVGALPPRKRSEASTVATAATSNAGGGSSNPAPSSASGALTAEAASSSSKVVPTAPSKPSESSESSDSASKAPSVVVTKPAVSDVTAPKQETSSPAKPVATTKLSDKDQLRKAELLAKFALKARPGEASGRDTNKLIGEAWQQFHSFANQERKQAAPRYRDKSQVFSDLKSFSKEFKLKTPVPADLEPLLAKKPADKAKTTVTPPSVPSSVSSLKPTTAVSRTKTESKTPPSPALLQAKAHALALAATLPNLSRLKDRSASDVSFPASSSAPAPPAAPAPSPAPVATQTPQAPAVQPAPPTPASEGDNASTISAAATDSDSQKFKLNVSAVEFNPTFGNPPAGQNSGSGSPPNGGLKSPAQGERQRPASVSGSTRGSSNTRNGSYSKAGYPKTPGGKPGPGAWLVVRPTTTVPSTFPGAAIR
ncbi:LsmAD domain-containing protein [Zopfochytrium polystomum]|nr:LsmAD domain-containing protein [Zopfochytrium polystomum]